MIGIIGALDQEIEIIKSKMQESQTNFGEFHQEELLGSVFYRGRIHNQDVVLAQCSIGKVNAAVVATTMIMKYNPDVIINTGISGALSSNVKVMDVVVANKISLHDEGEVFKRYYPFANSFEVQDRYVQKIKNACKNACKNVQKESNNDFSGVFVGEVVTGDEFVQSGSRKQEIKNKFPAALTVEMECGAIAKVCLRAKKDLLAIKTISDEADDFAKNSYDNFLDLAAQKSAQIVLELVQNF